MTKNKAGSAKPATKASPATRKPSRRRGRPRLAQGSVGREAIVAAATQLMEKLPPHKATVSAIARKASVDPALVRYYFKSRDQLMLGVLENIIDSWSATHLPPATSPSARLAAYVRDMVEFARKYRSMQRLMVDECAASKSAEVRRRVREMNEGVLVFYRLLIHSEKHASKNPTDPLFMFVAVIGMCEFFAAAQTMIQPLAPEGMSPDELAERYKDFLMRLVLDGLRSEVEPWSVRPANGP